MTMPTPSRVLKPYIPQMGMPDRLDLISRIEGMSYPVYSKFELDEVYWMFDPVIRRVQENGANPLAVLHVWKYIEELLAKIAERHCDPEDFAKFMEHVEKDCKETVSSYVGT